MTTLYKNVLPLWYGKTLQEHGQKLTQVDVEEKVLYMPERTFTHSNITSVARKSAECMTGRIAHYMSGIAFVIVFVKFVGSGCLQSPTLIPAVLFGVFTVFAPFFIVQPSFGQGVAASKTSNPRQLRLRSLMNHTAFGIGLYIFGLLLHWLL